MVVSPRLRVAVLLLVALVLVLTGARLATSTASPAPSQERDGVLLEFGQRDGRGVLPWSGEDMPEAPSSFRKFVRGELKRIWRQELGHTAGCKTSPRISVDKLRTDGFAIGDVFTKPLRDCETGGGYIAVWAVRKGDWKQVLGTQEVPQCQRLERWDIPAELGFDQCYEGDDLVPYTHP